MDQMGKDDNRQLMEMTAWNIHGRVTAADRDAFEHLRLYFDKAHFEVERADNFDEAPEMDVWFYGNGKGNLDGEVISQVQQERSNAILVAETYSPHGLTVMYTVTPSKVDHDIGLYVMLSRKDPDCTAKNMPKEIQEAVIRNYFKNGGTFPEPYKKCEICQYEEKWGTYFWGYEDDFVAALPVIFKNAVIKRYLARGLLFEYRLDGDARIDGMCGSDDDVSENIRKEIDRIFKMYGVVYFKLKDAVNRVTTQPCEDEIVYVASVSIHGTFWLKEDYIRPEETARRFAQTSAESICECLHFGTTGGCPEQVKLVSVRGSVPPPRKKSRNKIKKRR